MDLPLKNWKSGREFLGCQYPIIAGGMTWVSDFDLCRAVADAGAFPVLAAGNMPPDLFEQEVDRCIDALPGPFAVNLVTIAPNFGTHHEILKGKQVPFVVFAGNFPKKNHVEEMKTAGKKTMAFASTDSIARQMVRFGIDALLLEGSEAGGHIGHVSLTILLQQVLFRVKDVPIFVAGGIATGKMVAHMLLMGAAGVQLGTRFVMSEECTAHPEFKRRFAKARAREAVDTPQYDSRLPVVAVRALRNRGMEDFGKLQLDLLRKLDTDRIGREEAQMEVEKFWMGSLRNAVVDGDIDKGSLMAGQSVGLVDRIMPVKEIVDELVSEARCELDHVRRRLDGSA